jgi:cold shock CspA family protein
MNTQVVSAPAVDQWIVCKGCGQEFLWSVKDQVFYQEKKITPPRSCRNCRELRKSEAEVKNARIEAAVSSNQKQSGRITAYDAERGFGFIETSTGQVFFHVSAVRSRQKEIVVGAAVEFYEIESLRRKNSTCAERVVVVKTEEAQPCEPVRSADTLT